MLVGHKCLESPCWLVLHDVNVPIPFTPLPKGLDPALRQVCAEHPFGFSSSGGYTSGGLQPFFRETGVQTAGLLGRTEVLMLRLELSF